MNFKKRFAYRNKLKKVYLKRNLRYVFLEYIKKIFANNPMHREIPKLLQANSSYSIENLYPLYLRYTKDETEFFKYPDKIYESEQIIKYYLKKELLRYMFLLILDNFLYRKGYGVNFKLYYRNPMNSIRLTLEYQDSGKLYRDFFDSN